MKTQLEDKSECGERKKFKDRFLMEFRSLLEAIKSRFNMQKNVRNGIL